MSPVAQPGCERWSLGNRAVSFHLHDKKSSPIIGGLSDSDSIWTIAISDPVGWVPVGAGAMLLHVVAAHLLALYMHQLCQLAQLLMLQHASSSSSSAQSIHAPAEVKCVLLDGQQTVNEGQCVMVQEYNDHETFTRDSDSVLEAKAAGINDSYNL